MSATRSTGPAAIIAIDDDADTLLRLGGMLQRRFGADYTIATAGSSDEALVTLRDIADRGTDVALVLADQWLSGTTGVDLLAEVPAIHRDAHRTLLIGWGERSAADPLLKASAVGQIDSWMVKPWSDSDEHFYHGVSELLDEWHRRNRPRFAAVRIVGDRWDAYSHGLQDALERSGVPTRFHDAESPEGRELLAGADERAPMPVAILHTGLALARPTPAQLAEAMGVNTDPSSELFDVTVVGSGPAGLAAAVYAASEGLRVLVVEGEALGGQAGTSSLIRNYLGFPRGLAGADLTNRAYNQAWLLGARFLLGRKAAGLRASAEANELVLDDGAAIRTRSIVLAAGVSYRRIGIDSVENYVGRGVFYGAGVTEAQGMAGEKVFVVGGANSAGQAAVHLSRFAANVTILVRGSSLSEMSDYLVRELDVRDNITVRLNTSIQEGRGDYRVRNLLLRDSASGQTEDVEAGGVFIMIGASPRTDWLPAQVARDERGYVLTGDAAATATNPTPKSLETSIPGVFAVGDVRAGSMKRVAAAVGEGSTAISLVHQFLAESEAGAAAEGRTGR